jgi:AAA domain
MIRRITLHNYMSHAHTVIEPVDGLTVLVGPNNCGKSAVVSALETLCSNSAGAYMVRHTEKEARVEVETDEGHTCVWKRRGNTVSYVINGRDIHRVRGGIPDDLQTLLRLPKVDAGENVDPFDIHFGTQKSPIFLLNEPDSRAARFFASSSDAAILLQMQQRHRSKVKERRNEEKRLRGEIEKLDAELTALAPILTIASQVAQAEAQYRELEDSEKLTQMLIEDIKVYDLHLLKNVHIEREYRSLAPLESPPQLKDIQAVELLIGNLLEADRQHERERMRCLALHSLAAPPKPEDGSPLLKTIQDIHKAQQYSSRCSLHFEALVDAQPPPVLDDVESLDSMCQTLEREEDNWRLQRVEAISLGSLREPPTLNDAQALKGMIRDLQNVQRANLAIQRHKAVLEPLSPPPRLTDQQPLRNLISEIEASHADAQVYGHEIDAASTSINKLEAVIPLLSRVGSDTLLPVPAENRSRSHVLVVLGALAGIAIVVVLLFFGVVWYRNLGTEALDGPHHSVTPTDPAAAGREGNGLAAKKVASLPQAADSQRLSGSENQGHGTESRKTDQAQIRTAPTTEEELEIHSKIRSVEIPPGGQPVVSKAPEKASEQERRPGVPSADGAHERVASLLPGSENTDHDTAKNPAASARLTASTIHREKEARQGPGKEAIDADRQTRLKNVRGLLQEAETSREQGKYLEALLSYGQAAIVYPQELVQVESPHSVRLKFIDALKHYQADVERALQKAEEHERDKR